MSSGRFINSLTTGFKDILWIWKEEFRQVFRDFGVMLFFFALSFAYPILYSLIYNPEVVREVPMVVVDDCRTPLSRELCRQMDASPNAKIVSYCANMEEAKQMLYGEDVFGILRIPADFSQKIYRGEQGVVSFYSNMSILLYYKGFLMALTDVAMNLGGELQTEALEARGATGEQVLMASSPVPYSSITLYNPESGFASFLIPAILILILQQSLVLGIGMRAGGDREYRRLRYLYSVKRPMAGNVTHIVIGKTLCYFCLYIVPAVYVLHVVPWMFKFPQLGSQWEIYAFAVPFLLAAILFGITLSVFVKERESSFILFVFTSLVFLFISGVTWPYYAIPTVWKVLGAAVPATWGIEGFVRMNTAGASLADVRYSFWILWILAGCYFVTSCIVYHYQIRNDKRRRMETE